jgi:dihydrofolate synthase/folylpolyglutamate synthase
MDHDGALEYLENLGNEVLAMKFGLENIRSVLSRLGNPQEAFPAILIAGTNGKGSVARFVHGILKEGGLSVGLFTSPHLIHVEERIVVNGERITPAKFAAALTEVAETVGQLGWEHHPTYFETITATALLAFEDQEIDVAVLEVGMGGRLDSTNVYDRPLLSIITPIGMDHQVYLGNRIEEIAGEKAGIIHRGTPVLSAIQRPEAAEVIRAKAEELDAPLDVIDLSELQAQTAEDGRYAFVYRDAEYQLSVYGQHQVQNACLAIEAVRILRDRFPMFGREIQAGVTKTRHPAVLNKISDYPATFIDGGHNEDAARVLREFVLGHTVEPRNLVFGMLKDKDITSFLEILSPCFDRVFLTQVSSPRAATLRELTDAYPEGVPIESPAEALQEARKTVKTVLATGSLYLAGELLDSAGRR